MPAGLEPIRDDYRVVCMRPECGIAEVKGMVLSVWVKPLNREVLQEVRRVLLEANERNPDGLTNLSYYRTTGMDFSVFGDEKGRAEIAITLRAVDNLIRASASVIIGSGFTAATMRSSIAGFKLLVRPKVELKVFDTVPPAVDWLASYLPKGKNSSAYYIKAFSRIEREFDTYLGTKL